MHKGGRLAWSQQLSDEPASFKHPGWSAQGHEHTHRGLGGDFREESYEQMIPKGCRAERVEHTAGGATRGFCP